MLTRVMPLNSDAAEKDCEFSLFCMFILGKWIKCNRVKNIGVTTLAHLSA